MAQSQKGLQCWWHSRHLRYQLRAWLCTAIQLLNFSRDHDSLIKYSYISVNTSRNREYTQSRASQHKCSFMCHWQNPENMWSCFAFLMYYVLFNTSFPKNRTQMLLLIASVRRPQLKWLHYCFITSFFKQGQWIGPSVLCLPSNK